jgi:hypothetical protein
VNVSHISKYEISVDSATNGPASGSLVHGTTPALGSETVTGRVALDQSLTRSNLECDTEYHP